MPTVDDLSEEINSDDLELHDQGENTIYMRKNAKRAKVIKHIEARSD